MVVPGWENLVGGRVRVQGWLDSRLSEAEVTSSSGSGPGRFGLLASVMIVAARAGGRSDFFFNDSANCFCWRLGSESMSGVVVLQRPLLSSRLTATFACG